MTLEIERAYRCTECGEIRDYWGVHWTRTIASNTTDRCPHCHELSPGTDPTFRFTIRLGVEPSANTPPDRDPDFEHEGVEVYVVAHEGVKVYVDQCRGEATTEIEREEWDDLCGG